MAKKTALVLSGGGAKGAFQCAAEKYAREIKGYRWDIIAGVSVGALNGVMLAMGKYNEVYEIWNRISNDQVYTGGFNAWSALKLLFGSKSFLGNEPLRRMLGRELDRSRIDVDLRIGAVSLATGKYTQFLRDDPHLLNAILASTVMPVIWTPVDVSPDYMNMVDGGVRNTSPIGDVLDAEPDEIVIINCGAQQTHALAEPSKNILAIATRTLEIMLNEMFVSDMHEFLRINQLVLEAAQQGVTLHHPDNGRPLKYYECKIIEPDFELGDTLDFSQQAVQRSLAAGKEQAMKVLGLASTPKSALSAVPRQRVTSP